MLVSIKLFVAVHSSRQVKITDFGLAKLLGSTADSYQSTGGKVIQAIYFLFLF